MELTFNQAAKGVNKEFTVNITDTCERCDGKGNEPGTKVQHCHYCGGSGMVSLVGPPPPGAPVSAASLCFPTIPLLCVPVYLGL